MTNMSLSSGLVDVLIAGRTSQSPLDEPAFVDFYARTAGPLMGYLRRLTGNAALAEDLLQDAYLRFLSLARVPDDESHRKNVLFKIATNLARDSFRRAGREARATADAGSVQVLAMPPSGSARVEAGDVWSVLAGLSARDRELLLLAYVEGLTHKEIAHITGLMRASVKPLLFRARRRFAGALDTAGLGPAGAPEVSS